MSEARKTRSRALRYPAIVAGGAVLIAVLLGSLAFTGVTFESARSAIGSVVQPVSEVNTTQITSDVPAEVKDFSLAMAPSSPLVAVDQSTLSVSVRVNNNTDVDVTSLAVKIHVDRNRIPDTANLSEAVNEENPPEGQLGTIVYTGGIDRIANHSSVEQGFTFPAASLGLNPAEPGVYTIAANVTGKDISDPLSGRSSIVWGQVAAKGSVIVTPIIPLVLPSDIFGLAGSDKLAELTASNGSLAQSLNAAIAANAVLAIDPRVIASIRILADSAPTSAKDWLKQLAAATNPSFALQFSDADLSAQSQIGLDRPLSVKNLDFYDPKRDVSSQPTSTEGTALTADELSAWNYTLPKTAWPSANSIVADDLTFMSNNGFDTIIIDSDNLDIQPTLYTNARAAVSGSKSLIIDSDTTASLGEQLSATNSLEYAAGASHTASDLALLAQKGAGARQHIMVALDRSKIAGNSRITDTVNSLSALPWTQMLSLNDASTTLTSEGGSVPEPLKLDLTERAISPDRLSTLREGLISENKIVDFSAIFESPQLPIGIQRARVLNLFSTSIARPGNTFSDRTIPYFETDTATLNWVSITSSQTITVASAQSEVPVQVSNSSPFPAKVGIHTEASNNRITITDADEVTRVEANAQNTIKVPVTSRVSNGEVNLTVTLRSEAGQLIGTPVHIPLSIRAQWETIGLVVMGILVAGFLGFGAWRSVRNRKRRLDQENDPENETAHQNSLLPR